MHCSFQHSTCFHRPCTISRSTSDSISRSTSDSISRSTSDSISKRQDGGLTTLKARGPDNAESTVAGNGHISETGILSHLPEAFFRTHLHGLGLLTTTLKYTASCVECENKNKATTAKQKTDTDRDNNACDGFI